MKIAQIISTFPPHVGGMGNICLNESARLAAAGHQVTVFTLKYKHFDYNDSTFPFKVERLRPRIKIGDAGIVPQLTKMLKGFDLVHVHYPFYGGAEQVLAGKVPYVITYHMDAQTSGFKKFLLNIYEAIWPKKLFRLAKKVIFVDSEHYGITRFGKYVAPEKSVEILNGVDAGIFQPGAPDLKKLGLYDWKDKKIFIFAGNPLPVKRLDLSFRALKILNNPNAALLVVGGGYKEKEYEALAKKLGISESVRFMGSYATQKQITENYRTAVCALVTSDYESFSLSAVESMACGLPVIGTDIPGVRGRITDGVDGFLFKKGSAEDLAGKMQKILSMTDAERSAMGQSGRNKVIAKYSWEQHMNKLMQVYNEALGKT